MSTPERVARFFKHPLARMRWERTGEWDGSAWQLRESSNGLTAWMSRQEWDTPNVWRVAAEEGRAMAIQGRHFDYRLTPLGAGLVMERKSR